MTGMTIPGVDILGSKRGYDANKPWLFEDFDQLTFYRVSEDEYEKHLALFNSGRYEYQWEEVEFDMAEHNRLLKETRAEVSAIRDHQRQTQAKMDQLEIGLLEKWASEKAEREIPSDTIETLLQGNYIQFPSRFCRFRTSSPSDLGALDESTDPSLLFCRSQHHAYRSPPKRQHMENRGAGGR